VNDKNAALKSELDRMKTDLEDAKDTARKLKAKVEAANSEANRYSKKVQQWRESLLKRMMKSKLYKLR
jgi:chromosome segregation ATPase